MAKQNELKKLLRGKGLEALAPSDSSENDSQTSSENLVREKKKKTPKISPPEPAKIEKVPEKKPVIPDVEPQPEEKKQPFEPKFEITEIVPEEEVLRKIQEITGGQENYLVAWKAYTSEKDKLQSHFELGKPISFKINCAASKLPTQLEVNYTIEVMAFDVRTNNREKQFNLIKEQQIKSAYFQISYTIETHLKGLYKFHIILSIPKTDLFQVYEGNYFQVV